MTGSETTRRPRRADTSLLVVTAVVWLAAAAALVFALTRAPDDPASGDGMVVVPAGTYPVGLSSSDAVYAPPALVTIDAFFIDVAEVNGAQYEAFVTSGGGTAPPDWADGSVPPSEADEPVDGVSWDQARQYCGSIGKRLPTEAEWEVAGRGLTGQLLPWPGSADRFDQAAAPAATASQFGVQGLRGGVWEWVDVPYAPVAEGQRVVRGGSSSQLADLAYRLTLPGGPTEATGFRCAADRVAEGTAPVTAPIVHRDDFSDSASGWTAFAGADSELIYDADESLRFSVLAPGTDALVPASVAANDTFEIEVTTRITNPPAGSSRYGIAAAIDDSTATLFLLEDNGTRWSIQAYSTDEAGESSTTELAAGPSPTTPDVRTHRLRVNVSSAGLLFEINGDLVASLPNPDVRAGELGLYVEAVDVGEIDVHFDDLLVRNGAGRPFVDRG